MTAETKIKFELLMQFVSWTREYPEDYQEYGNAIKSYIKDPLNAWEKCVEVGGKWFCSDCLNEFRNSYDQVIEEHKYSGRNYHGHFSIRRNHSFESFLQTGIW